MEPQIPSVSTSAAYPNWVMLKQYLEIIKVEDSSCFPTDDDKTLAAARTSAGHPIQVSLRLAEPPAISCVFLRIPDGIKKDRCKVLAAHGDSILIQVCIEDNYHEYLAEHFVYNAGDHAADPPRPPSLWLLPPYYEVRAETYSGGDLEPREFFEGHTGILRCGDDDLVVAELSVSPLSDDDDTQSGLIYLFRSGEWNLFEFVIREDWEWDLPSWVLWDCVVPVDDRWLCWVDLSRGVMLLDVSEETLTVEYVQLPTDPRDCKGLNRNVCTTAGGSTLKFVNIFGRCCCGAAASCDCEHSRHAYTIHTWTMNIGNGDMEWVMDGMIDATQLWALDAYKGLPCDPLDCPIVSIDEPEVICFRLRGPSCGSQTRTLWQIMVNMRSKTIHSVSRHEEVGCCHTQDKLIPSNLSYFFNTFTHQIQMDHERSSAVVDDEGLITRDDDSSSPTLQPSSLAKVASVQTFLEMFEALGDIPSYGLGPDEVKAYRILTRSNDHGCRLTSLSRLPKDLRKDWLLMEIKATDPY